MATPNSKFQAQVTLNPYGGGNSNSVKPPLGELKIMFWNIQNLYEHGIMSKDEYAIEKKIGSNTKQFDAKGKPLAVDQKGNPLPFVKTTASSMEIDDDNVEKHMTKTVNGTPTKSDSDKFGNLAKRREWVARTINDSGADIVVIAELSIGTRDIFRNLNNRQVVEGNLNALKSAAGSFFTVDVGGGSWGPQQIQIDLNKLYDVKGNPWRSAVSAINAVSDFTCSLDKNKKIEGKKGKNSMLEMYGLLWRADRVSLGSATEQQMIRVVSVDKNGALIQFRERAPGHIEFFSAQTPTVKYFDLFCLHNLYGKETGSGAADRTRRNRGEGVVNLTKLKDFDPAHLTVVVGDFNLDAGKSPEAAFYKPLNDQMTRRIEDQKSSLTATRLVSEYDHIYTSKLGGKHPDDQVINIAEKYFGGSYKAAKIISDHLPIVAVLRSKLFPLPKQKMPLDVVTVTPSRQMARIKSEVSGKPAPDSIFLAAVRGYLYATATTDKDETVLAAELKKRAADLIYNSRHQDTVAKMVYRRVKELYADALWIEPLEELKPPDEWMFEAGNEAEYRLALKIARLMWNGWNLDDALAKAGIDENDADYDTYGYLVMAASEDEANWNYRYNPAARPPGIGTRLHAEFCRPELNADACYLAYLTDLQNSDAIYGSPVEAEAIGEIFGCPVSTSSASTAEEI